MTILWRASLSASVLIAVIMALRPVLRGHVSPRLQYALWLFPAARLLIPVSFEDIFPQSRFSVQALPAHVAAYLPETAKPLLNNLRTGVVASGFDNPTLAQRAAGVDWQLWLMCLWLAVAAFLTVWLCYSAHRLSRQLEADGVYLTAAQDGTPVYLADNLCAPCLTIQRGRPVVYLTHAVAGNTQRMRHVLAHELCHKRQYDHYWAVLRILLCVLYWFHPLVWAAACLSKQDGELACDQGAIAALGEAERVAYGRTLVELAGRQSVKGGMLFVGTAMSTGARSLRRRVLTIARKPRTRLSWLLVLAAIMGLTGICAFTNAQNAQSDQLFPTIDRRTHAQDGAQSVSFSSNVQCPLTQEQTQELINLLEGAKTTSTSVEIEAIYHDGARLYTESGTLTVIENDRNSSWLWGLWEQEEKRDMFWLESDGLKNFLQKIQLDYQEVYRLTATYIMWPLLSSSLEVVLEVKERESYQIMLRQLRGDQVVTWDWQGLLQSVIFTYNESITEPPAEPILQASGGAGTMVFYPNDVICMSRDHSAYYFNTPAGTVDRLSAFIHDLRAQQQNGA